MSTWRQGTKVPNTLYRDDVFVGSCVSGEEAARLVKAANAGATRNGQNGEPA